MTFMYAFDLLHAHNGEKFYRGINYFRRGPNISEIFGPGDPNIMGVQIFCYRPQCSHRYRSSIYGRAMV